MLTWLSANGGTLLVALSLLAAVIRSLLRDRRRGKRRCGGDCGSCPGCGDR